MRLKKITPATMFRQDTQLGFTFAEQQQLFFQSTTLVRVHRQYFPNKIKAIYVTIYKVELLY